MSEPLIVIDSSEIREGKLEELKIAMKALVEFVKANAPRAIAYHVHLDEDGTTVTVVQVHPDSASMEVHMKVAAPEFAKFTELVTLKAIDVYGAPSGRVLDQLRTKGQLLGDTPVKVHELHAGFARFEAASANL